MSKLIILLSIFLNVMISCPENDQRCVSCYEKDCRICYDSFLDASKTCQISSITVDYCLEYSTNGICKFCLQGYKTTLDGKCERIEIENCLIVNNKNECLECDDRILIQNGKCDTNNKCLTKNCVRCALNEENKEKCVMCEDGFGVVANNGVNTCVSTQITKCHYLKKDDPKMCIVCKPNYYYKSGQCELSTQYSIGSSELIFVVKILLSVFCLSF
jgi:hypothetical protein